MADSKKNYTLVIDAQVNNSSAVTSLGDEVKGTGEKFQKLQSQIKETNRLLQEAAATGDSVKFEKLKQQLDDLTNSMEETTFKSQQFDDQLSNLPGPIGQVGQSMQGLDKVMKVLKANPLIAVISIVVGIFLAFYESLKKTENGMAALNKVSDAFGRLLMPLIQFISNLAVPVIEKFAQGIEWVAKSFGIEAKAKKASIDLDKIKNSSIKDLHKQYTELLGVIREYNKKIEEIRKNEEMDIDKKNDRIETLNKQKQATIKAFNAVAQAIKDKTKTEAENLADELTISGSRMSAKNKELAFLKRDYEAQKQLLKDGITDKKKQTESLKNLEYKYGQDRKEIIKKYNKEVSEINSKNNEEETLNFERSEAIIFENKLKNLSDRDKELAIAQRKRMKDMSEYKQNAFISEVEYLLAIEDTYRISKKEINDKYDKLEKDAFQKSLDDAVKDTKEKVQKIHDEWIKGTTTWMDEYNAMSEDQSLSLDDRLGAIAAATENEITLFKDANNIKVGEEAKYQAQIKAIREAGAARQRQLMDEEKTLIYEQYSAYGGLAQNFGSLLSDLSEIMGGSIEDQKSLAIAGIVIQKAGAIAEIIANTAIANSKANAAFPLTGGAPWTAINTISAGISIASTVAAAVKGIQQINSASSSSASSTATMPTYPSAPTISTPKVSVSSQNSVGEQVSSSIQNAPIKTYVVASDVSSQQSIDRRTKVNASF